MGRQLAAQFLVVEIGMKIGEDRAPRFDPRDPAERVLDTEMARMRLVTQRVHDPDLGPGERRDARLGQPTQIAGIGKRSETEPQGGNVAMLLQDRERGNRAALSGDGDGRSWL